MNDELRSYLATLQPGPVTDTSDIQRLLARCWNEFTGDDGSMEGYKLLNRMESASWEPPVISFQIERHGSTVLASSHAALQRWTLNVDALSRKCESGDHREVKPMQSRQDVCPFAKEIAAL